jgi:hypothetical protein
MLRLVLLLALATTACAEEREAREQAKQHATELADQVKTIERHLSAATSMGRKVKAELDKVYKTSKDYDLFVAETGASDPGTAAHAARLAAMPHVTIGDVTVGYEEDSTRSIRGVSYAKHFRASWTRGAETVHVSFFSKEELDVVAFAAVLEKLVPIVERQLP